MTRPQRGFRPRPKNAFGKEIARAWRPGSGRVREAQTADSGTHTVPALRAVLMDYSQLAPVLADDNDSPEPIHLDQLGRRVDDIFDA